MYWRCYSASSSHNKIFEIDPYPTLEEAVKICHKAEIASKNRKCIIHPIFVLILPE